ncbi:unnamed protein product [Peniophora sp. CBMAI 1063]|nr:unnamed protein product [Peniophora sp. CBMAI 1063]
MDKNPLLKHFTLEQPGAVREAYALARRRRKALGTTQKARRTELFQTTLVHYKFRVYFRKPCLINRLSAELLMEILSYLPLTPENVGIRVHAAPFGLPEVPDENSGYEAGGIGHSDEYEGDLDISSYAMRIAQRSSGYGTCLAELHFQNGCARFCSQQRWNYLEVLRVCKHWRDTTYGCPQFWAHIAPQNLWTVARSLELSGQLPLSIVESKERRKWLSVEAMSLVLEHLYRVRSLEVPTLSSDVHSHVLLTQVLLDALAHSHATQLDTLHLELPNLVSGRPSIATRDWIEQDFPSLRVLILASVNMVSPCALVAPTLTELNLIDCTPPWKTASDFFQTISHLPQLEVLSLHKCISPPDFEDERAPVPSTTALPIPLKRLTSLELEGSFRFIVRVLLALEFPLSVTSLDLSYKLDEHGTNLGPNSEATLSRVRDKFAAYANAIPSGIRRSTVEYEVDLENNCIDVTLTRRAPNELDISLSHQWDENQDRHAGDILAFVRQTCGALFSGKHNVALRLLVAGSFGPITEASPTFTPEACFQLLTTMKGVSHLRLSERAAHAFIPWMVRRLHTAADVPVDEQDGETLDTADADLDDPPGWEQERQDLQRKYAARRQPMVEPTLLFPSLRTLVLRECELYDTVREDESAPEDILFSYIWLYLHAQQPRLVLDTVELTPRMLQELRRKLGSGRLDERSVWLAEDDDPYINVVQSSWSEGVEELEVCEGNRMKIVRTPRWSVLENDQDRSRTEKTTAIYG